MQIIPASPTDSLESLKPGVRKRVKVSTTALEVLELHIDPGHGLEPHDMPCKVAFYVLEGTGTFTYGERAVECAPGGMVHVDPGQPRFWANHTEGLVRLLVIKSLTEK